MFVFNVCFCVGCCDCLTVCTCLFMYPCTKECTHNSRDLWLNSAWDVQKYSPQIEICLEHSLWDSIFDVLQAAEEELEQWQKTPEIEGMFAPGCFIASSYPKCL